MSLLTVIIVIVIIGVVLYLINTYIPMDSKIKTILNWAVVIILILWLLKAFGLIGPIGNVKL